ncbi:MAG: hypothetical protein J5858_12845 [Lentisphaeria bacterium]|nr:hypothetical protein [Lentisphaeria bacterium]
MSEDSSKEKITLRKAVLEYMTDDPQVKEQILELLSSFDSRDNDIVYALLLELELLHKAVARQQIQTQEQHKVLAESIKAFIGEGRKEMLEIIAQEQTVFRSQFRRLVAIHRERFLTRILTFTAVLIIAVFTGMGAFCFYRLLWR